MARGPSPSASGHRPAAHTLCAAGRPYAWMDGLPSQAAQALASFIAAWLLLVAFALIANLVVDAVAARAQTAGPGGPASPGAVSTLTVTAPACPAGEGRASASTVCAAAELDRAAKLAARRPEAQLAPLAPGVDTTSGAAAIGLATPAAAAQQPGTLFGKPPGYQPPASPGAAPVGPFARLPAR